MAFEIIKLTYLLTCTRWRLEDRAFAAARPWCLWNSLPTLHMSRTWFVLGHLPSQSENVFNCSRHQCL